MNQTVIPSGSPPARATAFFKCGRRYVTATHIDSYDFKDAIRLKCDGLGEVITTRDRFFNTKPETEAKKEARLRREEFVSHMAPYLGQTWALAKLAEQFNRPAVAIHNQLRGAARHKQLTVEFTPDIHGLLVTARAYAK